ncbi:hypothetical protein N8334_06060 [Flavobacteriaceae bacterium]|jgi:hypothetical protein|nr:hypothetical protein [Flavobacteriaceae bacterium]MDC1392887.1 hypothetical protein [Flavobacteriaceae bacterium]|tara:strand:+ start:96 stop:485 length:390 start_codon:yes stop_codon:yes gene_type:complete
MSSILIQFVLFFVITGSDSDWSVYFENKKIEISFKEVLCDDVKNGVSFEYYMIKVKNNTNETLVINFYLGDQKDEENKVAFVLNPNEIKIGNCSYNPVELILFKADNLDKKSKFVNNFNLTSIEIIEVY